jgi:type II secretory pathway pseudopilin PulG
MRNQKAESGKRKAECAFSLVEVTLALGIAAFALLAIFGLLPVGLNSNQASIEQTAAASMARAIVADLRTTTPTSSASASYNIAIPPPAPPPITPQQLLLREDGSLDITTPRGANSRYLGYVTFTVPAQPKGATMVRLLITWPAAADLVHNPPTNYSGSYEIVTALDRH